MKQLILATGCIAILTACGGGSGSIGSLGSGGSAKSAGSERNNSGTIVRVIGEMDRIGYHNLELVLQEDFASDTITYQARAASQIIGRVAITPRSRIVTLGAFIPKKYRPNARNIVIQGLQNTLRIKR